MLSKCQRNGFTFVDNDVVNENDLWVDGIHLQESSKCIIVNKLINSFNHFFRIRESTQLVSIKKKVLLSGSESVRQNTLNANKECYSKRSLADDSEKKSINTTPNSLRKVKKIRIGNANKAIIGNLNIISVRNKFEQFQQL